VGSTVSLNELNLVAIGIFDKGDDGGAVLHGPGFTYQVAALLADAVTGRIGDFDFNGNMSVAITQIVGSGMPVVRELEHDTFVLILIAHKSQGETAIGIIFLTQQAHAQNVSIKSQGLVQVTNPEHGM